MIMYQQSAVNKQPRLIALLAVVLNGSNITHINSINRYQKPSSL